MYKNMGCASSQADTSITPSTNIDTNNDGYISRDEFATGYQREHCRGEPPDSAAWSRYEAVVVATSGNPTLDRLRHS